MLLQLNKSGYDNSLIWRLIEISVMWSNDTCTSSERMLRTLIRDPKPLTKQKSQGFLTGNYNFCRDLKLVIWSIDMLSKYFCFSEHSPWQECSAWQFPYKFCHDSPKLACFVTLGKFLPEPNARFWFCQKSSLKPSICGNYFKFGPCFLNIQAKQNPTKRTMPDQSTFPLKHSLKFLHFYISSSRAFF